MNPTTNQSAAQYWMQKLSGQQGPAPLSGQAAPHQPGALSQIGQKLAMEKLGSAADLATAAGSAGIKAGLAGGGSAGLAAAGAAAAPIVAPLAAGAALGKVFGLFNEGGQVPPQLMQMLQQAPPEVQQAVQAFMQGQIGIEELAQVLQQAGIPPELIQQVLGALQQTGGQPQQAAGPLAVQPEVPQGLNRGGKAQPSLAEQINWGGKYDKPKKASNAPKRSWYDPRGWVNKNDGGMIGHNPDTFINGNIASVHYPTPGPAQNTSVALNQGGPISLNPANKGQFTRRAQSAGMGTQAYANKVMGAPEGEYSPQVRRQANFARNASKWNNGGRVPLSSTQPHGPMHLNDGGEVDVVMQESSAPVKAIKQKTKRGHNEDTMELHFDTSVPPLSAMAMKGLGLV